MQCPRVSRVLFLLHSVLILAASGVPQSQSNMSVVHPVKVNRDGQFSSHSLVHRFTRGRQKRDVGLLEGRVYYKVSYKGRDLFFNLTVNNYLVSNNYILERRNGTLNRTERSTTVENDCHLIGTVTDSANARGTAAISTCEGLCCISVSADTLGESLVVEREREDWQREQEEARGREEEAKWVETMVVADSKLLEYHGSDNVEAYIFTIMNMVAGIFHDASIGNAIHMVLVRLILLQGEEKGLKIVHHADSSLTSFCAWQKNLNPQSDTHPAHHDVAVLVTRKDICAGRNQPCETLGLSHLSGMCQPHRSCNINEDSGLPVAFTIAHELGHSFGIQHDGQGNDCELEGRHPFIMSRQLMYDTSPLTWSTCSKDYITRFLDRGWGFCLDDRPSKKDMTTPLARLGVRYTAHHQCQLQYGPNATYCHEIDNVCQILWCSVNGSCRSKLDSPIDGTRCGPEKWCISGECVIVGKLPETVNGNWGQWSSWSHCSRTCGAGVQSADRECNHPKPEFGGKYCTGERRRYRICNTSPCQKAKPTFREMLCSEFDTVPYQNELYQWVPVASTSSPCELHCRPVDEHFSEKMLDAVTDGTPCFMNNNSKSICVNGVCKEVGCDYGIESNAVEDRCGVCLGDGSSCETVHMTFDGGDGFGYVDVGVIPKGARDIVVQEMEEAGNFLALRGQGSEEYFLNGQYIIQWNGEYKAAGTIFYYERSGNLENLTSPGPTKEPVMIQLLYQEKNPGIKYEYTIKKSHQAGNKVLKSEYRWKYGAWTDCSTSCGLGDQLQPVRCFELEVGVVDESLCDPETRPEDRHRRSCQTVLFLCRWWVGGWQPCTASCGPAGLRKRTVLCVRTVAGEERVLHPGDCKQLLKPKPVVPCNRDLPCGPEWAVGNWSAVHFSPLLPLCPAPRLPSCFCSLFAHGRSPAGPYPKKKCDLETMPRSKSLCALQSCPSLRRRPGPPLRYRRIYPPNRQPTGQPVTHTWGPKSTRPTTAPRTSTVSVTERTTTPISTLTTRPLPPSSTATEGSEVSKDGAFIKAMPTEEENQERDLREDEDSMNKEGSATDLVIPDKGMRYTPGDDYVVDEEEEGLTDLDIINTPTSLRTPSQSPPTVTTARLHSATTPLTPHTCVPKMSHTTGVQLTTSPATPQTSTAHRAMSTSRYPHTSPNTTPSIGPLPERTTRVPYRSTPKGPHHTPLAPYPTNLKVLSASQISLYLLFKCSTSCGLGAVWRPVMCSSQQDSDCANLKRPEPARTCHLRPCVTWLSGNWSKCPQGCEVVGRRQREVQCVDSQNGRPLRPFHCQALSSRPPSTLSCRSQPCQPWRTSPWGQVHIYTLPALENLSLGTGTHIHPASPGEPLPGDRYTYTPCQPWRTSPWGQVHKYTLPVHIYTLPALENLSLGTGTHIHPASPGEPLLGDRYTYTPCQVQTTQFIIVHLNTFHLQCSRSCGGGLTERLVYCPELQHCSPTQRPNDREACNPQPCSNWDPQDWEEVKAHRNVFTDSL
uniref:Peptidase M12B domain-containing protein n=1 Tax=Esox lucius TaxID=8010 RepID=A0A6Q2XJB6_ESOLU